LPLLCRRRAGARKVPPARPTAWPVTGLTLFHSPSVIHSTLFLLSILFPFSLLTISYSLSPPFLHPFFSHTALCLPFIPRPSSRARVFASWRARRAPPVVSARLAVGRLRGARGRGTGAERARRSGQPGQGRVPETHNPDVFHPGPRYWPVNGFPREREHPGQACPPGWTRLVQLTASRGSRSFSRRERADRDAAIRQDSA